MEYNIVKQMKKKIIAMRVEDKEFEQIETLRKKHFINISELFRKTIRGMFEKLENEKHK